MGALLLFGTVMVCVIQTVINKLFNNKNTEKGVYIFTAIRSFASMLVFVLIAKGNLQFDPVIWRYVLGFAVPCGITVVFGTLAVRYGTLSMTNLISSYAVIIPMLYGIMVLKEPLGVFLILGVAGLLLSIFCMCFVKEEHSFSVRWILCVLLSVLGSGMCSTVQKMQQVAFGNVYSNTFMVAAFGIVGVFSSVTAFVLAPGESMNTLKKSWALALVQGGTNGLINYFVILLNGLMPASVIFPVINGGSIMMVCVVAHIFFKERLTRRQLLGAGIGILSIIFFNLR